MRTFFRRCPLTSRYASPGLPACGPIVTLSALSALVRATKIMHMKGLEASRKTGPLIFMAFTVVVLAFVADDDEAIRVSVPSSSPSATASRSAPVGAEEPLPAEAEEPLAGEVEEPLPAESEEPSSAEVDAEEYAAPQDDVGQFLGVSLEDDVAFADYLSSNGCVTSMGSWTCPPAGTEFHLNTGHQVVAVIMRGPGATTPGYQGLLPGGFTFDATPEELTGLFGEPQVSTGTSMQWTDGEVQLIVDFSSTEPSRIFTVKFEYVT